VPGDETDYLFGSNYIDDSKINNHEIQTINWKWKARNSQKNRQRDELMQGFIIVLKKSFFHISWHLLFRAASAQITSMIDIKKIFILQAWESIQIYILPPWFYYERSIVTLGYNIIPENNSSLVSNGKCEINTGLVNNSAHIVVYNINLKLITFRFRSNLLKL
jgi:hypothetical protein